MYVTGVFLLFLVQEVVCVPVYRRMPSAKFINISREAFKKLNSETWQGSAITQEGASYFELVKNLESTGVSRLNSTQLKQLLGDSYDPKFMSETKPNRAWLKMKNELDRRSEFKHDKRVKDAIKELLNEKGIRLNKVEFEDLHFWLWNLTRCTVEPLWKDFGSRVWPRYVNFGKCSGKTTCSFPSGMKCRPSKEKSLRLLYWYCRKTTKLCFWSSFETKVIHACSCSC